MPKIVVSDPKSGKSHQMEIEQAKMGGLLGKRIGEEVEGGYFGLPGYSLKLTGGTDKQGFPMRPGIHKTGRSSLLLKGGPGYSNPKGGTRKRKTVSGELVSEDVEQLNLVVVKAGKTPLGQLGKKEGE